MTGPPPFIHIIVSTKMAPLRTDDEKAVGLSEQDSEDTAKALPPSTGSDENAQVPDLANETDDQKRSSLEEALEKLKAKETEVSSLKNELLEIRLAVKALASLNVALESKNQALIEEITLMKEREEQRRKRRNIKQAARRSALEEAREKGGVNGPPKEIERSYAQDGEFESKQSEDTTLTSNKTNDIYNNQKVGVN